MEGNRYSREVVHAEEVADTACWGAAVDVACCEEAYRTPVAWDIREVADSSFLEETFGYQVDVAIEDDLAAEAVVSVAVVEEAVEHCLEFAIQERILPPTQETARLAVVDSSYWKVVLAVEIIADQ